jgi:hypothetical protein
MTGYRLVRLSGPELVMLGAIILGEIERVTESLSRAEAHALEDQARQLKAQRSILQGLLAYLTGATER